MKLKSLEDLFVMELRDTYDAEKQLLKALKKMAKAASSEELRSAFETHLAETEEQVNRLEKVFEECGQKAKGRSCAAMKGLIEEGKDVIDKIDDEAAGDAALIAAAQKVEHYEIAAYGCMATWADRLGYTSAARLLKQTLAEEKATDEKLTALAEGRINREAEQSDGRTQPETSDELEHAGRS